MEVGSLFETTLATDVLVITREGAERIVGFAFELARKRSGAPVDRKKRVTCVDKSNVLKTYAFFRKVFQEVATEYPDVEADFAYADAMALWMVERPEYYDVVVTENMFGDILSDLAAATVGGLGVAPSAEIGARHALFQSCHGSAPTIAGKNVANPIATILSGGMMLEWLGMTKKDSAALHAAKRVEAAVIEVVAERKVRTCDLGGDSKTSEVGDAIAAKILM